MFIHITMLILWEWYIYIMRENHFFSQESIISNIVELIEVFTSADDLNWDFPLFEIFKNLTETLTNGMIMPPGKTPHALLWHSPLYLVASWVHDSLYFYSY